MDLKTVFAMIQNRSLAGICLQASNQDDRKGAGKTSKQAAPLLL
jgi:hypothetical protein